MGLTDVDNDIALGRYQSKTLPLWSVITQGSL